jgi:sulfide dehydrogenase cytochrome subunit
MGTNRCLPLCAGLLALGLTAPALSDEMASGRMLADTCAGCHGTDGRSPGPIPPLYGMSESHIASAMRAFREGSRRSTIMGRLAKGYGDGEIQRMAAHLAGIR